MDFLQAKANEPSFAKAGGYRIRRGSPPAAAPPRSASMADPPGRAPQDQHDQPAPSSTPPPFHNQPQPSTCFDFPSQKKPRDPCGSAGSAPSRASMSGSDPHPRHARATSEDAAPTSTAKRAARDREQVRSSGGGSVGGGGGGGGDSGSGSSMPSKGSWWRGSRGAGMASERFRRSRECAKQEWERTKKQSEQQAEDERREREARKRWQDREREERRRQEEQQFWEEQSKHKSAERPRSYRKPEEEGPRSACKGSAGGRASEDRGQGRRRSDEPAPPPPCKGLSTRDTYLELLGFGSDADPSEDELKKAYRAMAMRWHPDRPHNRERAAQATEQFQIAKEAFEYFMEEHRRKAK